MSAPQPPAEAQAQGGGEALEAELIALVAGPYHYHHKMDEHAEREGKAFDRCRELTIQNIRTWCATRRAMLAAQPPSAPVGVEGLVAEWRTTAVRKRAHGSGVAVAETNGYDMAANGLERALAQQPATCGTCREVIRPDALTGTTCKCATVDGAMVDRVTDAVVAWGSLPGDPPAESEQVAELRGVIAAAFAAHALAAQPGGGHG